MYRSGGAGSGLVTVQWLDGAGKTQPLLAKPGFYLRPRLSPDGQRLAISVSDGSNPDIWIYEWQRDTMTRLTFGGDLTTIQSGAPTAATSCSERREACSGPAPTARASPNR